MRKSIRWITVTIIFIFLNLVILNVVNDVLRIKVGDKSDMIHSFYDLKENSVDVLFFGSSHCYHSILPNVLWGEYGITSFVMGSPSQSIPCSYYLMKEALEYQKPKIVVLETYYCCIDTKWYSEARLRQAIDGMRLSRVKVEAIEDFFPDLSWKDKMSYYFPFLSSHARWDELKDYDFNQYHFLKGGVLNFDQKPQKKPKFPKKPGEIPDMIKEYLDKMIELCDQNEIELVFYASPIAKFESYRQSEKVNMALESYAAEKEIPFLFYQKMDDIGIDFSTDYYDKRHMNTWGAIKLSGHIGNWIMQEYGLTDHRQEEKYESWNADYQRYLNSVDARLES